MDHNHHQSSANSSEQQSCCAPKHKVDWLLWGSALIVAIAYVLHFVPVEGFAFSSQIAEFTNTVAELLHKMWWGVLIGIVMVGVLSGVPRDLVAGILGKGGTFSGVLRATFAGVFLDLCSHGILLVGMQLYKRGASLGQLMAFLIASPWNSFSLTLILFSLVGIKWTLIVLLFSLVIAVISGVMFDGLVKKGVLPGNPNEAVLPEGFSLAQAWKEYIKAQQYSFRSAAGLVKAGAMESRMILRWILFGIVLAGALRTFIHPELFADLFGPTLLGLGATILFATVLEVCSEGSMPVAVDFLLRAKAPGNMFAFLMGGVSTDYTEILSIKETTKSWKIAFFLPLVTLPQVILVAYLLNSV